MKKASIITLVCATMHITFAMGSETPEQKAKSAFAQLAEQACDGDPVARQALEIDLRDPKCKIGAEPLKLLKELNLVNHDGTIPQAVLTVLKEDTK